VNKKVVAWVEEYFYSPTFFQKIISFLLLPFTAIYCCIVVFKRFSCKPKDFNIPVISVGNLTVGGSGKTPFVIEIAKEFEKVFIILRGYKRKKEGTFFVSKDGKILSDVQKSGDEAILIAKSLKNASVLVTDDRAYGINIAKKNGAKVVILDDAFHRCDIKKFDILIDNNIKNSFCLPSGPYREPKSFKKYASLVVKEGRDFIREVKILNPTKNMVFVTAIANPKRVDRFLPKNIKKIYFEDHHFFTKDEVDSILKKYKPTSILTTTKDEVKLREFGLNLSTLDLRLKIDKNIIKKIKKYVREFYEEKDSNSSNPA